MIVATDFVERKFIVGELMMTLLAKSTSLVLLHNSIAKLHAHQAFEYRAVSKASNTGCLCPRIVSAFRPLRHFGD